MGVVNFLTIDREIVSENRSGVHTDYLNDSLGSVVGLIDPTQTIVAKQTYWPYGEIEVETGSWLPDKGYTGSLGGSKDSWGGIYNQARILDPATGQWISLDPLWPRTQGYLYAKKQSDEPR